MAISVCFLIEQRIFKKMELLTTDNNAVFPAVYVDEDENWHQQYMLLNFYGTLDCLDLDKSEIDLKKKTMMTIASKGFISPSTC